MTYCHKCKAHHRPGTQIYKDHKESLHTSAHARHEAHESKAQERSEHRKGHKEGR